MHQNAISCLHLWNKQQMASLSWLAELEPKGISQSRSDFWNMTTQHEKCASNIERLRTPSPSLPHSLQQWPKLGGRLSTYPEILVVIWSKLTHVQPLVSWYTLIYYTREDPNHIHQYQSYHILTPKQSLRLTRMRCCKPILPGCKASYFSRIKTH